MTKIRRTKRRGGADRDLHLFHDYFAWGFQLLQIPETVHLPNDADADPETLELVQEAWERLGPAFMRDWPEADRMPWAARMFGLPPGYENLEFRHAY